MRTRSVKQIGGNELAPLIGRYTELFGLLSRCRSSHLNIT